MPRQAAVTPTPVATPNPKPLDDVYPRQLRLDKVIFFLKLERQNNGRNR